MEIERLRRVQNTSTTSPNRELICKYIARGSRGYGTTNNILQREYTVIRT